MSPRRAPGTPGGVVDLATAEGVVVVPTGALVVDSTTGAEPYLPGAAHLLVTERALVLVGLSEPEAAAEAWAALVRSGATPPAPEGGGAGARPAAAGLPLECVSVGEAQEWDRDAIPGDIYLPGWGCGTRRRLGRRCIVLSDPTSASELAAHLSARTEPPGRRARRVWMDPLDHAQTSRDGCME